MYDGIPYGRYNHEVCSLCNGNRVDDDCEIYLIGGHIIHETCGLSYRENLLIDKLIDNEK